MRQHDVRLQAAPVQAGEAVPEPLRVVRAGAQVEVAVVEVAHLGLGHRVRLDQLVRRAARVVLHPVAGADAAGHLAQRQPVHRGRAAARCGSPRTRSGSRATRRTRTAGVPPTTSTPIDEKPSMYARRAASASSCAAEAACAAPSGWTNSSTTPMSPSSSTLMCPSDRGAPAPVGRPRRPRRSAARRASSRPGTPAADSFCHSGSSGRSAASTALSSVQQRLDLGGRRGPRIPLAHHHPSSLPSLPQLERKWLVRQSAEAITLRAAPAAVVVGRVDRPRWAYGCTSL